MFVAVNVKNAFKSCVARSLLVGTVIPFINVISSPRSKPSVEGSSAITAPNINGCNLHPNTYNPGSSNFTIPPPAYAVTWSKGIFIASLGQIKLDTVCTPLTSDIMKFTLPVLLITARDSVPVFVISPARLVNHLAG